LHAGGAPIGGADAEAPGAPEAVVAAVALEAAVAAGVVVDAGVAVAGAGGGGGSSLQLASKTRDATRAVGVRMAREDIEGSARRQARSVPTFWICPRFQ
jgi:hypothetical protein